MESPDLDHSITTECSLLDSNHSKLGQEFNRWSYFRVFWKILLYISTFLYIALDDFLKDWKRWSDPCWNYPIQWWRTKKSREVSDWQGSMLVSEGREEDLCLLAQQFQGMVPKCTLRGHMRLWFPALTHTSCVTRCLTFLGIGFLTCTTGMITSDTRWAAWPATQSDEGPPPEH